MTLLKRLLLLLEVALRSLPPVLHVLLEPLQRNTRAVRLINLRSQAQVLRLLLAQLSRQNFILLALLSHHLIERCQFISQVSYFAALALQLQLQVLVLVHMCL